MLQLRLICYSDSNVKVSNVLVWHGWGCLLYDAVRQLGDVLLQSYLFVSSVGINAMLPMTNLL